MAARQHWVIAVEQLHQLGFDEDAIRHRLRRGRLHAVYRGVYAVGRPALTRHGRWMAALLACGPTAVLCSWSAADLLGIGRERTEIEVSVRTGSHRRAAPGRDPHGPGLGCVDGGSLASGLRVRRRPGIAAADVEQREGIAVTGPALTLVDLSAAVTSPAEIERLVNEADRLDLVDPESLRQALRRYRGRRGVARLRAVLDRHTFAPTDSPLERRFLSIVDATGLPRPLTQQMVNGYRVDFYWPQLGLVVETDGLRYHRTAAQQARDRARDNAHAEAGYTSLRFTYAQVRQEPARVRRTLLAVARRFRAPRDA